MPNGYPVNIDTIKGETAVSQKPLLGAWRAGLLTCLSLRIRNSALHKGAPLFSAQDHTPEMTFPQTTINSMVEVVATKDEANDENFG